jgi:hypothetical protein
MDPIIIASGAIAILKEALAAIASGVAAGEISVETQKAQLKKIDLLRDGDFDGPEWKVER